MPSTISTRPRCASRRHRPRRPLRLRRADRCSISSRRSAAPTLETAAADCSKAIADHIAAARHIQITLGEQADIKGKLADLGLTLLGKTKLEEGAWREAIRGAADRSVNAWQDGQAIGEDWSQDRTQDMVVHFMQAAMKIGVSSGALGDDSAYREVQHKLHRAWTDAIKNLPEAQARALVAQLRAAMKSGPSTEELYKELLDKGKDIDFGAAFGQGAEGENKAMLWTMTNTTSSPRPSRIRRSAAKPRRSPSRPARRRTTSSSTSRLRAVCNEDLERPGRQERRLGGEVLRDRR